MAHHRPVSRPVTFLLLLTPLLILLIVGAAIYQTQLTSKVATNGVGSFVITATPATVQPGGTVTLSWGTLNAQGKLIAPGTLDRLLRPQEKIELVVKLDAKTTKRFTLLARTSNDGKELVKIPTAVNSLVKKGASASFALTVVDKQGNVTGTSSNTKALALKTISAAGQSSGGAESSGGGSGGGGSGGGGGGSGDSHTTSNQNVLSLNNISIGDLTSNSFKANFTTSLAANSATLSFRKKGSNTWLLRTYEFQPITTFSLAASNLEPDTDYEYKLRGFRYLNQNCRIATCASEDTESDVRTVHTNAASQPFQLTYMRACFDREQLSGTQATIPIVLLGWEASQAVPDTAVHFMTRETGTTEWFDWWSIFSSSDPNYEARQYHYAGSNKTIPTNIVDGPTGGGFKPNTAYEFQYQDGSGRALTSVIPFNTASVPPAPSAGLSTCRENIIAEQGSAYGGGVGITIYARNPSDSTNYRGYVKFDADTRQLSLNPDPTKLVGTVPLTHCGVVPESAYAPLKTILDDLHSKLPIRKTNLGTGRGSGKESIDITLSENTSYELAGYGNTTSDFPTPLSDVRTLFHQYVHDYCGADLVFP
jgi:hypothetical protein